MYLRWKKYLNHKIELIPLEFPGRGKRYNAPMYESMEDAINDIYISIEKWLDHGYYAFFGHSMGSLVSYEAIHKILEMGHQKPVHAFVSGRYPPHIEKKEKTLHTLPENEFIEEIINLGGTARELLENRELANIFVPALRADYKVLETYRHETKPYTFDFGITVLHGSDDRDIKREEIYQWQNYTSKECKYFELDGGHFFINDKIEEVVKIINDTLAV